MAKNKVTHTRNSTELLSHVLPNAQEYQCVNKKAAEEEPLPKYIIPQKQSRALLLATSEVSQLEEEPLQLAMISAAPFQYLARQKDVKVFIISIRDINYQLDKNKRPSTNPIIRVLEYYHDFLDIFLRDASNTVSAHSKHNNVIRLLSEKDHSQATMRPMSNEKLIFVKKFLEDNLKKDFIEASSTPCFLSIMLAVKPGGGIKFYVDYQKLNELIKKDAYPILLIAEIIAQLSHTRVFTKINIWQAFHKFCMAAKLEDLTTMITHFSVYK